MPLFPSFATDIKFAQISYSLSPAITGGGTATAGSWLPRPINTINFDDTGGISLPGSNVFILPAGKYNISATAMFYRCGYTKLRLRNLTADTTLVVGMSSWIWESQGNDIPINLFGRFDVASNQQLQLQYKCSSTSNTYGLGEGGNIGEAEILVSVNLVKVA